MLLVENVLKFIIYALSLFKQKNTLVWKIVIYIYYVLYCAQSCLTLCDPMDCSPPDSVHGILQARILFGCHFLLQGSPNPGIELASLALADGFFSTEPPGKPFNDVLPMK